VLRFCKMKSIKAICCTQATQKSYLLDFSICLILFLFHLIFILLLGDFVGFAPDETNYRIVFEQLYNDDFDISLYPNGWTQSEIFLRLIYLPAKIFNIFGLSSLLSLRVLSALVSSATLFLLLLIFRQNFLTNSKRAWPIYIAFFIPSYFLWSTLALRETFLYFYLVLFIYLISNMFKNKNYALIFLIGMAFYMTKPYLYVIMLSSYSSAMVITSIFCKFKKLKFYLLVNIILILPLILLFTITSNLISIQSSYFSNLTQQKTSITGSNSDFNSDNSTLKDYINEIGSEDKFATLNRFVKTSNPPKFNVNSIEDFSDKRGIYTYLISVSKFILLPFPFLDNGSPYLNYASIEFFAWIFLYIVFLKFLVTFSLNFRSFEFVSLFLLIFIFCFVLSSAIFESNIGTSLRHRSILLILILILYTLPTPKNNSILSNV
jgi:hypothetical protein